MAINLNKDSVYRSAKPKEKDYRISDGEGLVLLVKKDSTKRWMFYYRFQGKQNTLGFGVYPATTLENARRQAEESRKQIADGINPSEIKRQAKAAQKQATEDQVRIDAGLPSTNSFEYICREWLASIAHKTREVTQEKKLRRFELYVFPASALSRLMKSNLRKYSPSSSR